MTSTNKETHAISRLCEMSAQEPQSADCAAKLRVHHLNLARDVHLDAALQRSFAELRPAEASQSFLWEDGRETKPLLSFEAPRPAQQADSRSMAWRSSA